jgi:hypothetical protein
MGKLDPYAIKRDADLIRSFVKSNSINMERLAKEAGFKGGHRFRLFLDNPYTPTRDSFRYSISLLVMRIKAGDIQVAALTLPIGMVAITDIRPQLLACTDVKGLAKVADVHPNLIYAIRASDRNVMTLVNYNKLKKALNDFRPM